ncbi:MAG: N-acetyltransferase [Beijerinckiaceae bacterium]|nr:MAG: N-acetyltransferase [Beijerinckiaceae bacterium]
MKNVTFREAIPEDGAGMLAVHLAAIRAIDDRFYGPEIRESWAYGLKAEGYARSVAGGEQIDVAIRNPDEVLAFCGRQDGELFGLFVHPKAQGLGIGTVFLDRVEMQFAAEGRSDVELDAALNAQSFYEARGWKLIGIHEKKTRGGLMQRVARMAKNLKIQSMMRGSEG